MTPCISWHDWAERILRLSILWVMYTGEEETFDLFLALPCISEKVFLLQSPTMPSMHTHPSMALYALSYWAVASSPSSLVLFILEFPLLFLHCVFSFSFEFFPSQCPSLSTSTRAWALSERAFGQWFCILERNWPLSAWITFRVDTAHFAFPTSALSMVLFSSFQFFLSVLFSWSLHPLYLRCILVWPTLSVVHIFLFSHIS